MSITSSAARSPRAGWSLATTGRVRTARARPASRAGRRTSPIDARAGGPRPRSPPHGPARPLPAGAAPGRSGAPPSWDRARGSADLLLGGLWIRAVARAAGQLRDVRGLRLGEAVAVEARPRAQCRLGDGRG